MKEYEIIYRKKWEDYPEFEQVFAEVDYDAVVEFFKYCKETKGYAPSDIEIIKLEAV
ncbi:hypothetical protein AVT93_gp51 [Enterococcus phage vB_EfaS_IME196]|uniref:Uncharacterized protein n=1 Tax=Enterococcus phage vB_EfaS_IME196 TaxID=1747289 RepID=A0A0S2MY93_9CAUD|nr:hypothetical protein AVT93_gp51 [Enterococcus phage vB_EfaS_IME196]ALO80919.1 hypothetical protein [Enterococcus phage vB_EfaS_IME196]